MEWEWEKAQIPVHSVIQMAENTTYTEVFTDLSTEIIENDDDPIIQEQLKFIMVPLGVVVTVMILSAMVI